MKQKTTYARIAVRSDGGAILGKSFRGCLAARQNGDGVGQ